MPPDKPPTLAEVRKAYAQSGSVRKAGKLLGISGSRVHQILQEHGIHDTPLRSSDRVMLEAIRDFHQRSACSIQAERLRKHLGIGERALRYRLARLRERGLITVDVENGYMPIEEEK